MAKDSGNKEIRPVENNGVGWVSDHTGAGYDIHIHSGPVVEPPLTRRWWAVAGEFLGWVWFVFSVGWAIKTLWAWVV